MRSTFAQRVAQYLNRAEELRAIADSMHLPETSAQLQQLAKDYERLAQHAAMRAAEEAKTDSSKKD